MQSVSLSIQLLYLFRAEVRDFVAQAAGILCSMFICSMDAAKLFPRRGIADRGVKGTPKIAGNGLAPLVLGIPALQLLF